MQLLLAPLGARPRRQLRVLDLLDRQPPQCSPQLWSVVLAWRSLEALRRLAWRLVLRLLAAERSNAPPTLLKRRENLGLLVKLR